MSLSHACTLPCACFQRTAISRTMSGSQPLHPSLWSYRADSLVCNPFSGDCISFATIDSSVGAERISPKASKPIGLEAYLSLSQFILSCLHVVCNKRLTRGAEQISPQQRGLLTQNSLPPCLDPLRAPACVIGSTSASCYPVTLLRPCNGFMTAACHCQTMCAQQQQHLLGVSRLNISG